MTGTYDYTIRAGNSGIVRNERGIVVRVRVDDEPLDLTGNEIVFRVTGRAGQVLRKTSASGIAVDLEAAEIVVPITVAESRVLEAAGFGLTYDLERRPPGDAQRTILAGSLFIEPGANDDV